MRNHKYNAKKYALLIGGVAHKFDSKLEGDRYLALWQLQKAKQISDLEMQPEFVIQEGFVRKGKKIRAIKYRADFRYIENGEVVVEDAKGMKTPVYKIKIKMLLKMYPDVNFYEVERYKRGFTVTKL